MRTKRLILQFCIIFVFALLPGLSAGDTIVVNSTAGDRGTFTELECLPPGATIRATATGGATQAAAGPDITLREAICIANNTTGTDTIVLSNATYTFTEVDNRWFGANMLPPIGGSIIIEGNGAVLDAGSLHRVFFVPRTDLTDAIKVPSGVAELMLKDLEIINGRAEGEWAFRGGAGAGMGGAIFNQGLLQLQRVTMSSNFAIGGPISPITFIDPSNGIGGGMGFVDDDITDFGGGAGGASLTQNTSDTFIYLSGCGGGAGFGTESGGDAYLVANSSKPPVYIVWHGSGGSLGGGDGGKAFEFGVAAGDGGQFGSDGEPGAYCGGGGGVGGGGGGVDPIDPETEGEAIAGNGGFGGGGGSAALQVIDAELSFSLIGGNGGFGGGGGAGADVFLAGSPGFGGGHGGRAWREFNDGGAGAGMGGAIFNHGGLVEAINSTFFANRAQGGVGGTDGRAAGTGGSGLGGAIFNLDGIIVLTHSTLSHNELISGIPGGVSAGGALYSRVENPERNFGPDYQVIIRGSILANSIRDTNIPVSDCNHSALASAGIPSDIDSSENNITENLASVDSHQACSLSAIAGDPGLGPFQHNGGLTRTMGLSIDPLVSLAIDAASDCASLNIDQRELARPVDADNSGTSECDIGAFELQAALPELVFCSSFENTSACQEE